MAVLPLDLNIHMLWRNQQEIGVLKETRVSKPRLTAAGESDAENRRQVSPAPRALPPKASISVPTFSLSGKIAMKLAAQIAEEWTVGPIVASHLTSAGQDCIIQPFFDSKLRYQHIAPFLSDIEDVRDPFFHEFAAIVETEIRGGQEIVTSEGFEGDFKLAFERRRPIKKTVDKKIRAGAEADDEMRGLFQRFIERRRNVRGDRVGKPLAKYVEMISNAGEEEVRDEPGGWRLVEGERAPEACYFFSRRGARELFQEIYHPPTVSGRMVVSTTQIVTMDASAMMIGAGRGAKSRGYERQVLSLATEMAEAIEAFGGHPCGCCWTADVGGLEDETVAAEDRDEGKGGQAGEDAEEDEIEGGEAGEGAGGVEVGSEDDARDEGRQEEDENEEEEHAAAAEGDEDSSEEE